MSNSAFDVAGGSTGGTVSQVNTAGLATGGPIGTVGTVTVTPAVEADQEAAISNAVAVTPGVQQFHPSAAKAWATFNNDGTILASYNVASVVHNYTGNWTINWTIPFSSANYACNITTRNDPGGGAASTFIVQMFASAFLAGSVTFDNINLSDFQPADLASGFCVVAFGDQ